MTSKRGDAAIAETLARRQLEAYNARDEPFEMAVVFEVADGLIRRTWAYAP